MTALSRVVGGSRLSNLITNSNIPFDPGGTITGEDSRQVYVTPTLGTECTQIAAHATGTVDNFHKVLLIVPNSTIVSSATPTVFVLHGVGNDEGIILSGPGGGGVGDNGMTDAWLDQGWIVLSANLGGVTWGNEASRLGMLDIWAWFALIFVTQGFMGYFVSMGTCAGLNFMLDAQAQSIPVVAAAMNSGASNFQYTYDHNGNLVGAMRTAYGLAGGTLSSDPTYIAAVDTADGGHDPMKQDITEFNPCPVRFYASSGDTTISKANNTDLFNAKYIDGYNTGYTHGYSWPPEHTVVTFTGNHVAPASYQPADCVAFFQRALALL